MKVGKGLDFRLVAVCLTCILLPAFACPSSCACKWRDGKQLVECLNKGFKGIPDSLDPQTQILEFAGNDLQVLQKEIFRKLNILDLQKVYLQNCKLHKIDNNAFKGLSNLVELDLSNNYLTIIPCTNFEYSQNLMKLIMNNNLITNIKSHCFEPLSFLTNLELNDCKIETIEREAFSGLSHLQWLRLSGNKLSNIPGENSFPSSLKLIELQNNAWNCDCHLRDLYTWLLNFDHAHDIEPVCSNPKRLRNHTIASVYEKDLACVPKVTPISMQIEMMIGSNLTLECSVKAIPEAKILWLYQGHVIPNYTNTALESRDNVYYVENGVTDKKSELYIMNLGIDDNGTYSCVAENSAGKVWANYSLKVIVKEEPVVVVVSFPQRHLVVIVTIVFLVIVLLIAIIAVILLKSKPDTTRSRKKRESGKEVALCNQLLSPSRSNGTLPKNDGSLVEAQSHHAHYTVHPNREYDVNDMYQCNNMKSYVERNPDLINDAEICSAQENATLSLYKTHLSNTDGFQQETTFITAPMPRQVTWQDQQPIMNHGHFPHNPMNNIYQHSADVHLNPGYFLDNEGYPLDYGLPKHQFRPSSIISNYSTVGPFQTLPYNKAKVQNVVTKFANDNEFNTTSPIRPNFEAYRPTNVRRTIDGYPVSRSRHITLVGNGSVLLNEEFVPSPPEGYKMEPCHTAPTENNSSCDKPKGTVTMMITKGVPQPIAMNYQIETRCVDVNTQTANVCTESCHAMDCGENVLKTMPQIMNAKCVSDICSESPDEGYVDANDI